MADRILSPEEVAYRARYGQDTLAGGRQQAANPRHWVQALAGALQMGLGGHYGANAAFQEKEGKARANKMLADALMGGAAPKDVAARMIADPWAAEQGQKLALQELDPMTGLQRQKVQADVDMLPMRKALLQSQIDQNRAQIAQGRSGKTGLQPIYGVDAQGNPVVMQASPTGELIRSRLPDGVTPLDPYATAEARARGGAIGKGAGEAKVNWPTAQAASNRLIRMIDGVLNDDYLPSMIGPIDSLRPNFSKAANRVQARMNQINGATFIQAFESLKGGGQITETEGEKATDSLNRLRNTKQGTEAYIDALNEFRSDVVELSEIARAKARGDFSGRPSAQSGGAVRVQTIEDALKLPPGTEFIDPDGVVRVR